MVKGKTKSGFEFEVNEALISDYRFVTKLAALARCEEEDGMEASALLGELVHVLLGTSGERALLDHVKKNGVASFDDVSDEFSEILDSIGKQDTNSKN